MRTDEADYQGPKQEWRAPRALEHRAPTSPFFVARWFTILVHLFTIRPRSTPEHRSRRLSVELKQFQYPLRIPYPLLGLPGGLPGGHFPQPA